MCRSKFNIGSRRIPMTFKCISKQIVFFGLLSHFATDLILGRRSGFPSENHVSPNYRQNFLHETKVAQGMYNLNFLSIDMMIKMLENHSKHVVSNSFMQFSPEYILLSQTQCCYISHCYYISLLLALGR